MQIANDDVGCPRRDGRSDHAPEIALIDLRIAFQNGGGALAANSGVRRDFEDGGFRAAAGEDECAGRNEDRPAVGFPAGGQGILNRGGVVGLIVWSRSVTRDVEFSGSAI